MKHSVNLYQPPSMISFRDDDHCNQHGIVRVAYRPVRRRSRLLVQDVRDHRSFHLLIDHPDYGYRTDRVVVAKDVTEAEQKLGDALKNLVRLPKLLPKDGELCMVKKSIKRRDAQPGECQFDYHVVSLDKPGKFYEVSRPSGIVASLFIYVLPANKAKQDQGFNTMAYRKATV